MDLARVRADFDEIATFGESGSDRYDPFLLSLVPASAVDVLEVGCGLGRLCSEMAAARRVVGIDVSQVMIERARLGCSAPNVVFVADDFLGHPFADRRFDCIISVAALHHMPFDAAVSRMSELLKPGGRLIIHDMRRDAGVADTLRACVTFAHHLIVRFFRTGRPPRSPAHIRAAWIRHGQDEHYLSFAEAAAAARAFVPSAQVVYHSMWRYTIVWDKP